MRLIDADAITKDSEAVTAFCGLFKKCGMKRTSACLAPTCEDCVARFFKHYEHLMPTIDAEPVKHGKWLVTWQCHNYHEMDSGDYAYQYSECMVHVTCSVCCKDSDSFKWDKSGKGKSGIDGLAYKMQIAKMNALKTKFCPHCGAKMDEK